MAQGTEGHDGARKLLRDVEQDIYPLGTDSGTDGHRASGRAGRRETENFLKVIYSFVFANRVMLFTFRPIGAYLWNGL